MTRKAGWTAWRLRVRKVAFVRQDCWVGLYWKRHENSSPPGCDPVVTFYVCLIPMVPIIIDWFG